MKRLWQRLNSFDLLTIFYLYDHFAAFLTPFTSPLEFLISAQPPFFFYLSSSFACSSPSLLTLTFPPQVTSQLLHTSRVFYSTPSVYPLFQTTLLPPPPPPPPPLHSSLDIQPSTKYLMGNTAPLLRT